MSLFLSVCLSLSVSVSVCLSLSLSYTTAIRQSAVDMVSLYCVVWILCLAWNGQLLTDVATQGRFPVSRCLQSPSIAESTLSVSFTGSHVLVTIRFRKDTELKSVTGKLGLKTTREEERQNWYHCPGPGAFVCKQQLDPPPHSHTAPSPSRPS